MRYLMIAIAAASLVSGGVALAQMPPGGDGPLGPMQHGGHEHHEHEQGGYDHGEREHMDMMEHMHHQQGRPHGTAFHIKRGDTEVDIACSERESVQSCVSGASALLDKLGFGATPAKSP